MSQIALSTEGLHPSSELCLEALHWLHSRADFSHILDLGCGNGFLSLTCASIWDASVLAADISPKAVADTHAQIIAHGLESRIEAVRSDGFSNPLITQRAPYDLIICNLLAELLTGMALEVKKHTKPVGYCIFSGILDWKAADTKAIYTGLGFEILQEFNQSPWQAWLLKAPAATEW